MKDEFYAHSREGIPPKHRHRLEDHLNEVAEMARTFANDFSAGDWAYLAGLWHDLRKCPGGFKVLANPDFV
jgi:CRISPR-associated endonuclease/helicase Cas3